MRGVIQRSETTVSADRDDAIRAELFQQIEIARQTLSNQLAELRRSDAAHLHGDLAAQGGVRLIQLNALRDQLVSGAKDVAALRAGIASAVADIRAYTSDISAAVTATQMAKTGQTAQAMLQQASDAARRTVADFSRDFYERRIFDSYLQFASNEDKDAYRRREEEYRLAIANARAENTPEGNLRALELSIEQLKDAGAHGATRSAAYLPLLTDLEKNRDQLRAAIAPGRTATAPDADVAPSTTTADAPSSASLPPEVLASLRTAKISVSDQAKAGHGLSIAGTQGRDGVSPSH